MIAIGSGSGTLTALMGFCGALTLASVAMLLDRRHVESRIRLRVEQARSRALGLVVNVPDKGRRGVAAAIEALGGAITESGLLSARTRTELEQTLRSGGLVTSHNLELFIGSKLVLGVGLPVGTFALLRHAGLKPILLFILIAFAAVGGLMAPNMIIGQRRKTYLSAIEKGLADGLDMMVICAEAGLALEAALQRVSVEVVHAHPKLAAELAATSSELALGSDSRVALANMGARTGLDSLKRLGATLTQSVQYGTPLSSALRTLAVELRQETLTRFEERAARLPVLLTIPMILFILPCVFLIVAGPIVVQVLKTLNR